MKNQAKKKLTFNKKNIIELNEVQLQNVNGGWITSFNPNTVSILPPIETSEFCGQFEDDYSYDYGYQISF